MFGILNVCIIVNSRKRFQQAGSVRSVRFRPSEVHRRPLLLTRSSLLNGGIPLALSRHLMLFLRIGYVAPCYERPDLIVPQYKKPSLLKRISLFGATKRPPQLSAAEQLIQHSIRKRATAFVDARDDLETKIGRLSRRLNFLMTESDLWRDKFVTFEQYAEKLSVEAQQLRAKINKEQREAKRLSGLVTLTAAEKTKLQNRKVFQFHLLTLFSNFVGHRAT